MAQKSQSLGWVFKHGLYIDTTCECQKLRQRFMGWGWADVLGSLPRGRQSTKHPRVELFVYLVSAGIIKNRDPFWWGSNPMQICGDFDGFPFEESVFRLVAFMNWPLECWPRVLSHWRNYIHPRNLTCRYQTLPFCKGSYLFLSAHHFKGDSSWECKNSNILSLALGSAMPISPLGSSGSSIHSLRYIDFRCIDIEYRLLFF